MRSPAICLAATAAMAAMSCGGPARSASTASSGAEVEPAPGRAIVGRVLDKATGKPLGFANVRAIHGEESAASDMSNADGTFRLELPPGTYTVIAESGTRRALYDGVLVLDDKNTKLNFEIAVPTARSDEPVTGSIEGRVIDKQSREAFAGALISAASPALSDAQMAIADDDGVYRFELLPPGTYVVSIYYHLVGKGNVEVRRTGVQVVRGSSERVDLELDTTDGLRY